MNKPFDPTKPVQTRAGRPARIICTDRKDPEYPIVALVTLPGGDEGVHFFTEDGRFFTKSAGDIDLVNISVKRVAWVNVYRETNGGLFAGHNVYESEEQAKTCGGNARNLVFTARIEWEE